MFSVAHEAYTVLWGSLYDNSSWLISALVYSCETESLATDSNYAIAVIVAAHTTASSTAEHITTLLSQSQSHDVFLSVGRSQIYYSDAYNRPALPDDANDIIIVTAASTDLHRLHSAVARINYTQTRFAPIASTE